jgi:hypothetical protein
MARRDTSGFFSREIPTFAGRNLVSSCKSKKTWMPAFAGMNGEVLASPPPYFLFAIRYSLISLIGGMQ